MTNFEPEETWEAEISALLGGLDPVSPPEGFIDRAIDHRPLHAGRTLLMFLAGTVVVVGAALSAGVFQANRVVPPVEEFTARHDAAELSLLDAMVGGSQQEYTFEILDNESAVEAELIEGVEMPAEYEPVGVSADEVEQAVYSRGDDAVSVFIEPGTVEWDDLPNGDVRELSGTRVWFDEENDITVVQARESVLTIVGLDADQVGTIIDDLQNQEATTTQKILGRLSRLTAELGFVELGS